jgi:hypothetical protein
MNRSLIIRMLGALLLIEAAAMVPSFVIALVYGEGDAPALAWSVLIILAVGLALFFIPKKDPNTHLRLKEGFIITALVALLILLVVFIVRKQSASDEIAVSQETAAVDSIVTDVVSEEPVEEATPQTRRWDGSYTAEYCAGDTYGGTGICYTTNIRLSGVNGTDEYKGTMTIDGYQIGWSGSVSATAFDDNSIKIWVSSSPNQLFNSGDAVCRIKYNDNGTLSAEWFSSMVESQFVDQNTKIKED